MITHTSDEQEYIVMNSATVHNWQESPFQFLKCYITYCNFMEHLVLIQASKIKAAKQWFSWTFPINRVAIPPLWMFILLPANVTKQLVSLVLLSKQICCE